MVHSHRFIHRPSEAACRNSVSETCSLASQAFTKLLVEASMNFAFCIPTKSASHRCCQGQRSLYLGPLNHGCSGLWVLCSLWAPGLYSPRKSFKQICISTSLSLMPGGLANFWDALKGFFYSPSIKHLTYLCGHHLLCLPLLHFHWHYFLIYSFKNWPNCKFSKSFPFLSVLSKIG
jgi:hypothetical protein